MKTVKFLILLSIVFLSTKTYSQWELIRTIRTVDMDQPFANVEFLDDSIFFYTTNYLPPSPSGEPGFTIRRTFNDGDDWENLLGMGGWGIGPLEDADFPCPDTGYASYNMNAQTKFARWIRGEGWEDLSWGNGPQHFDFVNGSKGFGVNGNLFYRIENGEISFVDTMPINIGKDKMHFLNTQTGFIHNEGLPGKVFRTSDGGQNWELVLVDSTHTITDFCTVTDSLLYICAYNNLIYRSDDAGESWTSFIPGLSNISKISFYNRLSGITRISKKIFRTDDGGYSWTLEADLYESHMVEWIVNFKCINDCTAYLFAWKFDFEDNRISRKEHIFKNSAGLYTEVPEQVNKTEFVSIYPNPVLNVTTFITSEPCEIEIYNTNQKLLFSKSNIRDHFRLDMTSYPKGVYLVRLNSAKGITIKKILKL